MKFKKIFLAISILLLSFGCQTVKNKTDAIVEKENQKLGKYIGQSLEKTSFGEILIS